MGVGETRDHYDVLIEVYEAGDPDIQDSVDASTHQNLFALPLESDQFDDGPRDVIIHGSVGSTTLGGLTLLGLFVLNSGEPLQIGAAQQDMTRLSRLFLNNFPIKLFSVVDLAQCWADFLDKGTHVNLQLFASFWEC